MPLILPPTAFTTLRSMRQHGWAITLQSDSFFYPHSIFVTGKDSARFLHGQLSNEVSALTPGSGNRQARLTRTGHLLQTFSIHQHEDGFLLLTHSKEAVHSLIEDLETFHFSEDLHFRENPNTLCWLLLSAPSLTSFLKEKLPTPLLHSHWENLEEESIDTLKLTEEGSPLLVIKHSFTGDPSILFGSTSTSDLKKIQTLAVNAGFHAVESNTFSEVFPALRLESGNYFSEIDFPPGKFLLPSFGIEQETVSYQKGCYLGQEVIARLRTYGSPPEALRALSIEIDLEDEEEVQTLEELSKQFPKRGEPLIAISPEFPNGKKVGTLLLGSFSSKLNSPFLLAFIDREFRTPGLQFAIQTPKWPIPVTVRLLPLHHALEGKSQVLSLFNQAVISYSENRDEEAIQLLEKSLSHDPSFQDAYEALGVILGNQGRYHEAVDFFRRLEELAPQEAMVNTNLSLYLMKMGEKELAEEESTKATLKKFSNASSTADALFFEKEAIKKREEEAQNKIELFEEVLSFDPNDPIALFGMCNALFQLKDYKKAEHYGKRALEVDKNNSALYALLGQVQERQENLKEAFKTYQAGIEIASKRGDLKPLQEMETRSLLLKRS